MLKSLGIMVKQSGNITSEHANQMRSILKDKYQLIGYVDRTKLIDLYSAAIAFFSGQ
ncbi:MAG: hypothetical protein QXV17_01480 [Candidatus Micrarchaeaceae archaeon]